MQQILKNGENYGFTRGEVNVSVPLSASGTLLLKTVDGIQLSDLADDVQTTLGKAETAVQLSDTVEGTVDTVQTVLGKAETAVQPDNIVYGYKLSSSTGSAVTLADRTITTVTGFGEELTLNFPETSLGIACDFALRLVVPSDGSAPSLKLPTDFTYISIDGLAPDITTAEQGSQVLVYFSQVSNTVFLIRHQIMKKIRVTPAQEPKDGEELIADMIAQRKSITDSNTPGYAAGLLGLDPDSDDTNFNKCIDKIMGR